MKEKPIVTSLMTSSVRKTSFTIGLVVCQGTLMSTKRTHVVRMWRQSHGCPASGGGIDRVFFSVGKQHDTLKKRTINQYDVADLWWQRSLHRWWWHIQETQVVYSVRRLVLRWKGAKTVVVIWAYSVALVWLLWFVSKRFVNEIIMIIIKDLKKLDYQRA
jgi:hypothetical protein